MLALVVCGAGRMAKSPYRRLPSLLCVISQRKNEGRKPANGLQGQSESSWSPGIQVVLEWSGFMGRDALEGYAEKSPQGRGRRAENFRRDGARRVRLFEMVSRGQ